MTWDNLISEDRIPALRHHHPRHLRPSVVDEWDVWKEKQKPTHRSGPSKARASFTYRGYIRSKTPWLAKKVYARIEPCVNTGKVYPYSSEREVSRRRKQMEVVQ